MAEELDTEEDGVEGKAPNFDHQQLAVLFTNDTSLIINACQGRLSFLLEPKNLRLVWLSPSTLPNGAFQIEVGSVFCQPDRTAGIAGGVAQIHTLDPTAGTAGCVAQFSFGARGSLSGG